MGIHNATRLTFREYAVDRTGCTCTRISESKEKDKRLRISRCVADWETIRKEILAFIRGLESLRQLQLNFWLAWSRVIKSHYILHMNILQEICLTNDTAIAIIQRRREGEEAAAARSAAPFSNSAAIFPHFSQGRWNVTINSVRISGSQKSPRESHVPRSSIFLGFDFCWRNRIPRYMRIRACFKGRRGQRCGLN